MPSDISEFEVPEPPRAPESPWPPELVFAPEAQQEAAVAFVPPFPEPPPLIRRRREVPWVTLTFLFVTLLFAAAQLATTGFRFSADELGSDIGDWVLGAKIPSLVAHGEWWRLVTANFLHGSPKHLFSNMLGLLLLGMLVEGFYGRARFAAIYVLSSVAGAASSYFFTHAISLGASTGIMGLTGALLYHNFRYRALLPRRLVNVYPLLIGVVVVQFALDAFNQQVDLWGHTGGFVAGLLLSAMFQSRLTWPLEGPRDVLQAKWAGIAAAALLLYGGLGLTLEVPAEAELLHPSQTTQPREKAERLRRLVERKPYFLEARISLADLYAEAGDDRRASDEFAAALALRPKDPQIERMMDVRGLLLLRSAGRAYQMSRWEEAVDLYSRARLYARDPELVAQANNGYAWTLVDKLNRDFDSAEKGSLVAIQADPKSSAIADTLAWVYYKQGRFREALATQLRAMELMQRESFADAASRAEIHYHLGAIYEKLGNKAEAVSNYQFALNQGTPCPPAAEALERLNPPAVPPSKPNLPTPRPVVPALPQDPAVSRGII